MKANTSNQKQDLPALTAAEEEWIEYITHSDEDEPILMKCNRCGYEEDVPAWVLGELAEADGDNELTCICMKCSRGIMHRKD